MDFFSGGGWNWDAGFRELTMKAGVGRGRGRRIGVGRLEE